MIWIPVSFIYAAFHGLQPLISEYFKVRALHLMFWRRVTAIAILLPVVIFLPWPENPSFYILVILASLLFGITDLYNMGLAARNGAGVVSRVEPLLVCATFILWTVITPLLLVHYADSPLRTAGILVALGGSAWFTLALRNCPLSLDTLKLIWPAIILGALGTVLSASAMRVSELHSGVFCYTFLQGITVFTLYGILMLIPAFARRVPHFGQVSALGARRTMLAGVAVGINHVLAGSLKYYGISLAPNPAYVLMIGLTAPLWILLVYKLVGRKEKADIVSGLGIVACAALLVMCTQL